MIVVGVVLAGALVARWQRDSVIVRICPREILCLESAEERYIVHGRGLNAFLKQWRTWAAVIAYTVALGVPSVLVSAGLLTMADTRVSASNVMGVKLGAILCAMIPPFFLIPIMIVRFRRWMRVYLREYLNDHGIPICQNCGYDLRGQGSPRCPECGTPFEGKDTTDNESQ